MPESIHLTGLHKRFGEHHVLEGVDLQIGAGEFLSLLGPSGCGKSTLLRIVAGLELADGGNVRIGQHVVDHLPPSRRNVAMVFQNYALYPHMSVRDNIALPLVMQRLPLLQRQPGLGRLFPGRQARLAQIHEETRRLAESLGLAPLLDRKPGQLSGGQRQRVALARAMVRQPAAFLMDEPLSNLDAKLRLQVRDELADMHRRLGATFLYVTHDQTEAMTLSSRVAVMHHGRILQVATPDVLYERPSCLSVARFVGSPSINVLALPAADGVCRLAGERAVAVHGPQAADLLRHGGHVAIRPEGLKLLGIEARVDDENGGHVAAVLNRVEHHGADWVLQVAVPSWQTQLTVRTAQRLATPKTAPGAPLRLGWCWSELQLFDRHEQRVAATVHAAPRIAAAA